ncbi:MAG: ribbon-helix-helix domain-containing protein [Candidatus Bathyarchaeia archaeon]
MNSRGVYFRIESDLLEEFAKIAESMGLSKSEAIRLAIKEFIKKASGESMTGKMLGLLKHSRLSLKELDEVYAILKHGDSVQ